MKPYKTVFYSATVDVGFPRDNISCKTCPYYMPNCVMGQSWCSLSKMLMTEEDAQTVRPFCPIDFEEDK